MPNRNHHRWPRSRILERLSRGGLILLLCWWPFAAAGADTGRAYVHFGAILLGDKPAGANARHQRVGYLPIGTLVSYDADAARLKIFNYAEDVQDYEDYVLVHSNIGFSGYIRDDLITDLDDKILLLPLRYRIIVKDLDSDEILGRISRAAKKSERTALEVLREEADQYIVRFDATRANGESVSEGRIKKEIVDGVHVLRLSRDTNHRVPDIDIGSPAGFVADQLENLSRFVSDKTGETAAAVFDFLSGLNALQCRISSAADAELSAKIFGTGLGLKFSFVLANQNSIYSLKSISFSGNGSDYASFYVLRDVKCIDGIPHRLENLILLSHVDPADQIIVSKTDLPPRLKQNWHRFDTATSNKMINIDGFAAYEEFMQHIHQSAYLSRLPQHQRSILSHILLKELAYFSTPR